MRCIILTAEQAESVSGRSDKNRLAALDPVLLTDGTFVLDPSVLDNTDFAQHFSILQAAPQRDVSITEYQWYADSME